MIRILKKSKEVSFCSTKGGIKDEWFQKNLVRAGWGSNEGHCTPYVKIFCDILREYISLHEKADLMFHSKRTERIAKVIYSDLTTTFIDKCYQEVRKKMMGTSDRRILDVGKKNRNRTSVTGFLMIFGDETVITLKSSSVIPFSANSVRLIVSVRKSECLIDNEHIVLQLLLVCCTDNEAEDEGIREGGVFSLYGVSASTDLPLERSVRITRILERGEKWIWVIYGTMKVVMRPVRKWNVQVFFVKSSEVMKWKSGLLLVLYC